MKNALSMQILLIGFLFINNNAYGSLFTWKLRLLDKNSREEKNFTLDENELKVRVPGKASCKISSLSTKKEDDGFVIESRMISCTANNVMSYVHATCTGMPSPNVRDKQMTSLGIAEGPHEYGLMLYCER